MAKGDLHTNFVKIGPAVPQICLQTERHTQTDRHTDRQTDRNTALLYRGRVINQLTD